MHSSCHHSIPLCGTHTNLINTTNLLPLCLLMQHLISPILQNIPILFQIVPHVLHLLHPFCHEFIQGTTCRDGPIKQLHVENTFSIRLWKATSVDQREII